MAKGQLKSNKEAKKPKKIKPKILKKQQPAKTLLETSNRFKVK